jgi:uncharacterized protein DUF5906/uncharacterized protein DUF3854
MVGKLATSCLGADDARALGFAPAPPEELGELGHPRKMAFVLPYFGVDGRRTGFRRYRYLEDTRSSMERQTEAKPARYVQPPDTLPEAYFPPLVDWRRIAEDPSVPLVVTEGELKAACCTKAGRPCIGLGGVHSFKSSRRGLPMLRSLAGFDWKGRDVVVAYDSDAHTNHLVVAARNELCRELLERGALPRVADLPPAEDGSKQGIDDLCYAEGPEALSAALDAAESFAASQQLHELNAEVAYVRDPGLVVVVGEGRRMRASDFVQHAYSNRHFYEESLTPQGKPKIAKKKAAQAWLEWERRFELSRMTYAPGQPRVTREGEYNTWPGWGVEPRRGDVKPWRDLLDFLFFGMPEERRWFERWCALPLQRPGAKMYAAAVLWGVETGTGKSLAGVSLGRIYGTNYTLLGDRELNDGRNAWAEHKQFVLGDDVTGHDQRRHADRLKAMITQPMIRIDQKFVPSYTVPDLINYMFTSNHPDAFFLEDRDRRYFVHEVTEQPMPREFYVYYMRWLDSGGSQALFHHLLGLDVGGQRPEDRAMETVAREAMIEDGHSSLARWVRALRATPDAVLRAGQAVLQGDLWSSADILRAYDSDGSTKTTASAVSREMKRAGFRMVYRGMQVPTRNGQQRLFAVRDRTRWEATSSCKAIAAHYDATRGAPPAKKYSGG